MKQKKHILSFILLIILQLSYVSGSSIGFIREGLTIYNFEVEGEHNYFVGNSGLLVHNECNMLGIDNAFKNFADGSAEMLKLKSYNNKVKNIDKLKRIALNKKIIELGNSKKVVKFISDFADDASGELAKFSDNPNLVDAWKSVINHADLRVNTQFLENIVDYSDDMLRQLKT